MALVTVPEAVEPDESLLSYLLVKGNVRFFDSSARQRNVCVCAGCYGAKLVVGGRRINAPTVKLQEWMVAQVCGPANCFLARDGILDKLRKGIGRVCALHLPRHSVYFAEDDDGALTAGSLRFEGERRLLNVNGRLPSPDVLSCWYEWENNLAASPAVVGRRSRARSRAHRLRWEELHPEPR